MDEAGVISSLFDDVSDTFFFAIVLVLQVFEGKAVITGNLFGITDNFVTQWLGKLLFIVKDANILLIQIRGHSICIAKRR